MTSAPRSAPRSARARAREELTREIKDVARLQLATHGSSGLSLRAVARELGMVSSAVYRYFPSRDDLLTALIVDAYTSLGEAAAGAEAAVRRTDLLGRWMAVGRATREWALERPQEYALLFGSPVPGYRAPQDTIDPASRLPLLLVAIAVDSAGQARELPRPVPRPVQSDLRQLARQVAPSLDEAASARAVMAWTQLIGSLSFELFGQLVGVVSDYPAWYDVQLRASAADVGVT